MKKLVFLFLLVATSAIAGITQIEVNRIPATATDAEFFRVKVWGLKADGGSKTVDLRTTGLKAKYQEVENCAQFNLNREAIRCIIIFDGEAPKAVDFHMSGAFAVEEAREFDLQSALTITRFREYLESITYPEPVP